MVYHTTFEGLHHWHHKMFEKFGWMILAKNEAVNNDNGKVRKHMTEKIKCYLHSIERLHNALEEKIKEVHEEDRKNDLGVLLLDTAKLLKFAQKTLISR